jgi:hypothetical protein
MRKKEVFDTRIKLNKDIADLMSAEAKNRKLTMSELIEDYYLRNNNLMIIIERINNEHSENQARLLDQHAELIKELVVFKAQFYSMMVALEDKQSRHIEETRNSIMLLADIVADKFMDTEV